MLAHTQALTPATRAAMHPSMNSTDTSDAFDALVFIGRFQPVHAGHVKVFEEGLARSPRLYVLVGSTEQPRNLRNPFGFAERRDLIQQTVSAPSRTAVLALPDVAYNDQAWISAVLLIVERQLIADGLDPKTAKVGLIGHKKDASSYYLSLFPNWKSVGVDPLGRLSATGLRDGFLRHGTIARDVLPAATQDFLATFQTTPAFNALREERAAIDAYRATWANSPYPPTFVTTDALVVQAGHILLVRRADFPGKGLSALPGGFLDAEENLIDGMLRELREETQIAVSQAVLRGSIKTSRVFDDPHRSARGRSLTHAYLIQLEPNADGLPHVEGGDDAAKAYWLPLAKLDPRLMFEDHYHIIQSMIAHAD